MHILWGSLMIAAGLFMLVCASLKSQFILYRLLCARSQILWGANVHRFYLISGTLVVVFGGWVTLGGSSEEKGPRAVQDYNSVRADLRAQVEKGQLTREEAIVKLAEARAKPKSYGGKKKKSLSPELEAIGKDLKEQVAKGDLTQEAFRSAWIDAALEAGQITEEEAQAKRQSKKQRAKSFTKGRK